ncbi:MAG: phenylalanine--tRNA ligase subunit beta [Candidatus Gracilibacteria bacterium]
MKISINWLREFVDIKTIRSEDFMKTSSLNTPEEVAQFIDIPNTQSTDDVGRLITLHTAEVEEVEDMEKAFDKMVIGKILSVKKHPNADKLVIAEVDIAQEKPISIVCGGQNLKPDMLVPVAPPGSKVRWHGEGDLVELGEVKIRGEKSFGMICAGEEIGLDTDNLPGATEVRIKDLSYLKVKPGTPLAVALQKNDVILTVDNKSLTHRPDLWGHYGFAREFSVILKKPLKPLTPLLKYKPGKPTAKLNITIQDKEICPAFSGCILTNVEIKDSPDWLKNRLRSVGLKPINNIVDITNFVMVELGQPMHAYDRKKVKNDALIIRYAKKGETIETIDHKTRTLFEKDPVVADSSSVLGVAGIMGGAGSEINESTTEIILEAANWNPIIVRKSSSAHGLRSEASQRFEKGLDPSLTELALQRAMALIQECSPSAKLINSLETIRTYTTLPQIKITIDPKIICNKIGTEISTPEIKHILTALGFKVTAQGKKLNVIVPSHRATGDVGIAEDLIEEVARIHGYDKIPALLPELPIKLPIENQERFFKHEVRTIFAAFLGFTEVIGYSFYSEDDFKKCRLENMRHIRVKNALSQEQTHMRVSLIPGLLKTLAKNNHERKNLKLFEIGHTYKEIGEFMPLEEKWIAGTLMNEHAKEIFYDMKGALSAFLKKFRTPSPLLQKCAHPPLYAHPQKCIEISVEGEILGYGFVLHPAVAKAFDLDQPVGLFEINFTKLVAKGRELTRFKELPKFPTSPFDISLLIDRKKEIADVEHAIRKADPAGLVQSITLFDIYEGKNIPTDKKSLAFTIELRHNDHTLTDTEFHQSHEAIFKSIRAIGGEIRGE